MASKDPAADSDSPLRHYFKHSLIIHGALLLFLIAISFGAPKFGRRKMELIVLPKGTSLDAVLTKDVLDAMNNPKPPDQTKSDPPPPFDNKGTPAAAAKTPEATPSPFSTAPPIVNTPALTPQPSPTAVPTATPAKTMTVTPKASPTAAPKPSPTPKTTPKPTPKPTVKPKPSPQAGKADADKMKQTGASKDKEAQAASRQKKPPVSAYDLPKATPAGAQTADAAPGQTVGVPGIREGVEGAPLPLDKSQGLVSMLWATRARMRIQTNFTVPPGVNDPNMTCVVEWEILPDGKIQNVKVAKSTGNARYDSYAVDAVTKTASLGALPPEIGSRSVWTSLTFVYSGE